MNVVLLVVIAILIVYGFVMYYPWGGNPPRRPLPWRKRPRRRLPRSPSGSRRALSPRGEPTDDADRGTLTLRTLRRGDVVSTLQHDYLVTQRRVVREENWTWIDYTLEDGDDHVQLSVGEHDDEIFLLEPVHDMVLPHPPPSSLRYRRNKYHMTAAGQAVVENTQERFRYYTYEGPPLHVLIAEDWGTHYDLYLGAALHPNDLTLLPGSTDNLS